MTLYGSTEAYITSSCARAELTDSSEPTDDPHWYPAMSIPQVITPEHRVVEGQVQGIFPRMSLEQADIEAIDAGKKFIHFRGFVKYNDVFGTERWARFRRVWELSQARNAGWNPLRPLGQARRCQGQLGELAGSLRSLSLHLSAFRLRW